DFDGTDDNIFIASSSNLRPQGDVTVSGWFKLDNPHDSNSLNSQIILTKYFPGDSANHAFNIILAGTDYTLQSQPGALIVKTECQSLCSPTTSATYRWTNNSYRSWNSGQWYHFLANLNSTDSSYNTIYINGQRAMTPLSEGGSDGSGVSSSNLDFEGPWKFGHGEVENVASVNLSNAWFDGQLDEIRIAQSSRTDSWAQLIYENQNNPQSFIITQSQEYNFPRILSFGVYDPGDGFPQYWANVTSGWIGTISSVTINIDSSPNSMTFNGTYWVYSPAGVVFNTTYNYQIISATNDLGQTSINPSSIELVTYDKDIINPTIDGTPLYVGSTSNDGFFRVNVSDSWGDIDTVLINIINHSDPDTCGGACYNPSSAIMVNDSVQWINDSISLFKGTLTYQIVVNDTSGNVFTSGNQIANVLNKVPSVSSITLTPTNIASNGTLLLNYDYNDPENAINITTDFEDGSEIRWYLNGTHQSAYDDDLTITSSALSRYDRWNVSVRPKDGSLFGQLQWYTGPLIVVGNSAPEASSLVITPALPTNTSDLTADWSFFDKDGDTQPVNSSIIRWYMNGSLQSAYNDMKIVSSSATSKNQNWWFNLSVYDGSEYSVVYTSPIKTIVNSVPVASNVAIEGTPRTTDILNATWDYSDADFDGQASYRIRWYMDNGTGFSLQGQFNDSFSIVPGFTAKGQVWNFTLEVYDGTNYSLLYTSPTKTIVNSVPTANTLTLTTDPVTTINLVANWTYADVDNDSQSLAWRVRWYRDGLLVSSFNDLLIVP
ncbi:MAG: hypothetical protein ACW99Q_25195, partial [Candidatus Kariarchaeaceae archaeon]